MTRVIDTNVALVVKFGGEYGEELVTACEDILIEILKGRRPVVTDSDGEIVEEYFHQMSRSGSPTLADEFARYVHDQRFTWHEQMRPDIEPHPEEEHRYGVLEGDDGDIDPSDRKFVAAAKVADAPVIEGTDTKWLNWGDVLDRHGVRVEYAHEETIRAMYREKFDCEAP